MKCKTCKDKPLAKKIKLIKCILCHNSRTVSTDAKSGICNACSEKYQHCVICGKVIKFNR